jgi:hypothetical protein
MKTFIRTALAATAIAPVMGMSSAQAAIINASGLVAGGEIDDYFFSVTAAGTVTINVTPTTVDDAEWDTEINLFIDDGVLDLADFIENDDDGGGGHSSQIIRSLGVGDYLLRIGNFNFGSFDGIDPEIIAAINGGQSNTSDISDYDLSISGDVVAAQTDSVPEPMTLSLLGAGLAGIGMARRKRS